MSEATPITGTPGYVLSNVEEAPPLATHASSFATQQNAALIQHVTNVLADVPRGKWIRVVGPGPKEMCSKAQGALYRHKKSGRVPSDVKVKIGEYADGSCGVYARYAPEEKTSL